MDTAANGGDGAQPSCRCEVDLEFCQREGIDVVRRKSGGGCIYADEGNIMFSLITPEGAVEPIFNDYAPPWPKL